MKSRTCHRSKAKIALVASIILAIGSVVPVWKIYYVGPLETTGKFGTLWVAVEKMPNCAKIPNKGVWELQQDNILLMIVLLSVAFTTGWLVFRKSRVYELSQEAKDYQERAGGSVRDGTRQTGRSRLGKSKGSGLFDSNDSSNTET